MLGNVKRLEAATLSQTIGKLDKACFGQRLL